MGWWKLSSVLLVAGLAAAQVAPTGSVDAPAPRGGADVARDGSVANGAAQGAANDPSGPGNPGDGRGTSAAPALPPAYDGSFEDGLSTLRALAAAGDPAAARAFADRLLAPRGVGRARLALWNEGGDWTRAALDATAPITERLGWNGRPDVLRARVRLERGLVSLDPEDRAEAERDFGRALALAPAGPLRLAASYDLALLPLLDAEDWRAKIPEFGGPDPNAAPAIPGVTSTPGAPQDAEDEPDPLEEARRAYEEALDRFVDRLRLDWRDADTRANVEWIQRRLDELDELERQREEQEQEQQEQQDQQQDGEQQDQQDGEPQDEQEQEPQDEQQDGEQEQQSEQEPDEEPDEPEDGDEQDTEQDSEEREARSEAEPREVHLSEEEMQRLLNRLEEHEREAERLREMRRQRGSNRVDRDW